MRTSNLKSGRRQHINLESRLSTKKIVLLLLFSQRYVVLVSLAPLRHTRTLIMSWSRMVDMEKLFAAFSISCEVQIRPFRYREIFLVLMEIESWNSKEVKP